MGFQFCFEARPVTEEIARACRRGMARRKVALHDGGEVRQPANVLDIDTHFDSARHRNEQSAGTD